MSTQGNAFFNGFRRVFGYVCDLRGPSNYNDVPRVYSVVSGIFGKEQMSKIGIEPLTGGLHR
jgi:hypothetical protein